MYEVRRVLADPEALARWTEAEEVVDRYSRTVGPAGWTASPASDETCAAVLAAIAPDRTRAGLRLIEGESAGA